MKKLVITVAMSMGLLASSYAQGFFNFDNSADYTGAANANTPVIGPNGVPGEGAIGAVLGSGGANNYDVGYLWTLGTTYAGSSLTPAAFMADGAVIGAQTGAGSVYGPMSPFIGTFFAATGDAVDAGGLYGNGTIFPSQTGLPDGQMITIQVVAWYDDPGTSFLQAYNGGLNVTWSPLYSIRLAAGLDTVIASTAPIIGFVPTQPVPEPGTLVLAGLGSLSLLLFRRRK